MADLEVQGKKINIYKSIADYLADTSEKSLDEIDMVAFNVEDIKDGGGGSGITYSLIKEDGKIKLIGSDETVSEVSDANTTYELTNNDGILSLNGSDGTYNDIDVTLIIHNVLATRFVSVSELPETPDDDTFYFIQGE